MSMSQARPGLHEISHRRRSCRQAETPARNARSGRGAMKILIIEDDPVSLKLTSDVLQGGGHVVMLATSADQAIYSLKAVRPDVIAGSAPARHQRPGRRRPVPRGPSDSQ